MGRNSQYQQDAGSSRPQPKTRCITHQISESHSAVLTNWFLTVGWCRRLRIADALLKEKRRAGGWQWPLLEVHGSRSNIGKRIDSESDKVEERAQRCSKMSIDPWKEKQGGCKGEQRVFLNEFGTTGVHSNDQSLLKPYILHEYELKMFCAAEYKRHQYTISRKQHGRKFYWPLMWHWTWDDTKSTISQWRTVGLHQ